LKKFLGEVWHLQQLGIAPKRFKIGKGIKEEEVVALFGPCSRNNYRYYHNEDESLISKVETLWMIYIKKPKGPTLRFD